jgi:hypothetical protein
MWEPSIVLMVYKNWYKYSNFNDISFDSWKGGFEEHKWFQMDRNNLTKISN